MKVDNSHQGNSRWYSGSGIYRPAWLYVAEPPHLAHWGTAVSTPEASKEMAVVRIESQVVNESDTVQSVVVQSKIYGPDNSEWTAAEARATIEAGVTQSFVRN